MKLALAYYGAPILRQKGQKISAISDEIKQLVADMIETMEHHNGVGLAAPQVHRSLALFIAYGITNGEWDRSKVRVFINPKIISTGDRMSVFSEGCLSIPKLHGNVERPDKVLISAQDLEGQEFTHEFVNLEARVFFHENDHINGVLFIDRIDNKERKLLEPALKEIKKKYKKS